jgi:glutathione synthase/RimK-type ligase-like ATP-grasp enzyme
VPHLVVPCDDAAAGDLHRLHAALRTRDDAQARPLVALIEGSLGSPDACALALDRGRLMEVAAESGVRLPATAAIQAPAQLDAFFSQHGPCVVLKADRTWGGQGVAIAHDRDAAQRALAAMLTPPHLGRVVARMLLDRDLTLAVERSRRAPRSIIAQAYVTGVAANRAVACWRGEVLAGISVEALRTLHPTGPATVVRMIDNEEMSEAARRVVARLRLSGLWGFDFVLDRNSDAAWLIEANPRATPVCHLVPHDGNALPAALLSPLTGQPAPAVPPTSSEGVIVMFPGEWRRDPASPALHAHYHDVPWTEPDLVRDCLELPWSERGLLARAWARVRKRRSASHDSIRAAIGMNCRSEQKSPATAVTASEVEAAGLYGSEQTPRPVHR